MPTLIRFVVVLALLAGIVYGVMWALVWFVEPQPRDMSDRIPARELFEP